MKKFFFLLFALIQLNASAQSTDIPTRLDGIDELYVPTSTSWQMDVLFSIGTPNCCVDSIYIKSNSGSAAYIFKNGIVPNQLTLSNNNLNKPLEINPEHDSIYVCIVSYNYFTKTQDRLDFGYKNSCYPSLSSTTSIKGALISNKPKIGVKDEEGTTGVLKGHMYDKNGQPFTKGVTFSYKGLYCLGKHANTTGEYFQVTYPFCFRDTIRMLEVYDSNMVFKWYAVKPFLAPAVLGDTVVQDIYFLDETTAVAQPQQVAVAVYPNPASEELVVAYEGTEANLLVVSSIAGQEVEQLALPAGQSPLRIPLDAHYQPGMYVACLLHNGAVVQRLRFVVQW